MKRKKILFILVLVVILPSLLVPKSNAQTSSSVNAAVKISVCGNGIIENGEDCEGTNLNNKSCQSLGYSGGTLSCDISCSFDTSQCIAPTPTPTPTPAPTPTVTPTTTPVPTSSTVAAQSQVQTSAAIGNTPTPTPTALPISTSEQTIILPPTNIPKYKSILPPALKVFDFNGDGKIDSNLNGVISLWVNSWKQYLTENVGQESKKKNLICDINRNGSCNLDDFSILLYYVGR